MCAGAAAARAANKQARRDYAYRMKVRKRKHMNKRNRYQLAKVQYRRAADNINQGLGRAYSRAQTKLGRMREAALRSNQAALLKTINKSNYAKAIASGRTGRSVKRMATLEAGELGRFYAQQSRALTLAGQDFKMGVKAARRKAVAAQNAAFAKVTFTPTTDVAPPPPVMQNVGAAMFGDILGFGMNVASVVKFQSDSRLKEDIKKIGTSIDGHNIYKFKYLDSPEYYTGVMAEEVLAKKPEAVSRLDNGYWGVDYSQIDVEMREVV